MDNSIKPENLRERLAQARSLHSRGSSQQAALQTEASEITNRTIVYPNIRGAITTGMICRIKKTDLGSETSGNVPDQNPPDDQSKGYR